jgi:hypothetical protein
MVTGACGVFGGIQLLIMAVFLHESAEFGYSDNLARAYVTLND